MTKDSRSNSRHRASQGSQDESSQETGRAAVGATASAKARGQTTLDFTAGMSVFLLVLIAVLLFIPGTLAPFTQGSQDDIVTVNRIGDQLSEGTLGDPADPHILNTSCTISFFEDSSPAECRYEGSNLQSRLGVTDRTRVNITLQGNVTTGGTGDEEILCWNGSNGLEEQRAAATCGTTFAIGATPPEGTGDTVTARRVVSLNQSADSENKTDVALIVEVW